MPLRRQKTIIYWLYLCAALIALMVCVGGITRLTESGLSIVEWKPVTGILPPIGAEAWQDEFAKYQQTPEYLKVNHNMTLPEFKRIFFWEYLHRLLGRLTGAVFLLPLLYFMATKQCDKRLSLRLSVIFLLGGLQGFMGWYMVKSGLVDRPDVSQYRLAAHLFMAFFLYAVILWTAFDIKNNGKVHLSPHLPPPPHWLCYLAYAVLGAVSLQVVSGAFVAGLNAGLIYNTFPTMDGQFLPSGLFFLEPWYINSFENVTTVQFNHRLWAMVTSLLVIGLWFAIQKQNVRGTLCYTEKNKVHILMIVLVCQFFLGVMTLLHAVPIPLASLHQLGALALFTFAVAVVHMLHNRKARLAPGFTKTQEVV